MRFLLALVLSLAVVDLCYGQNQNAEFNPAAFAREANETSAKWSIQAQVDAIQQ